LANIEHCLAKKLRVLSHNFVPSEGNNIGEIEWRLFSQRLFAWRTKFGEINP